MLERPRLRYARLVAGKVSRQLAGDLTVQAIRFRLGVPISIRPLAPMMRGNCTPDAISMNTRWPFRDAEEWRWVLAEELGHWMLRHTELIGEALDAADRTPDHSPQRKNLQATIGLIEQEARAFAEAIRGRAWPVEDISVLQESFQRGPHDARPYGCARLANHIVRREAGVDV